jgi:hypothetical protein
MKIFALVLVQVGITFAADLCSRTPDSLNVTPYGVGQKVMVVALLDAS